MRPGRWATGAAVVLVAFSVVSCSGTAAQDADPRKAVTGYLDALSRGDISRAAAFTSDPVGAARELTKVRADLDPSGAAFTLEQLSDGSSAQARFSYRSTWQFGPNRQWSYSAEGELRSRNGGWRIAWDPSVIHPRLHEGQSIGFTEVSPASSRVTDRQGQPLLAPQVVTLVNVLPSKVSDRLAVAGELAATVHPFDPSITPASVQAELFGDPAKPVTVIVLRERDAAGVRQRLQAIPGVELSQQSRLLSVDPGESSVALSGVREAWQSAQGAAAGWRVSLLEVGGAPGAQLAGDGAKSIPDLTTTLDARIQAAARQAVGQLPQQAAIVALQPSTGQVLAVAQNAPADAEGPIALTGLYPPGSTFKMITASAALQAGSAKADTELPCPGSENIEGRQIPNEDMFDLGTVPLHTAFAHSCNTTLARLAVGLAPDALRRAGLQLGLGVDYNTPGLTTVTGSVPVATTSAQRVESSIGQGKVVTSPFGMALATAAIANGRLPAPSVLTGRQATADQTPPPVPAAVSAAVRDMMRETVTSGTATSIKDIAGLRGKTGTAQYGDGKHSHGWFVGIDGDLAFAVLVVGGEASAPAVAAAGRFLRPIATAIPR